MRPSKIALACGISALLVSGITSAALPKPPRATAKSFLLVDNTADNNPSGWGRIHMGDAGTGKSYQISEDIANTRDYAPAWSGDGTRVAYVRSTSAPNSYPTSTLYIANLLTMQQFPMTTPSNSRVNLPVWKGNNRLAWVVEPWVVDKPTCVWAFTQLPIRTRKQVHCFGAPGFSRAKSVVDLQWAADGQSLIATLADMPRMGTGDYTFDISFHKIDVASGQTTLLNVDRGVDPGFAVEATLAPDMQQAYIATDYGSVQDWANLKTGEVIKNKLSNATSLRFSNDSKLVAVGSMWDPGDGFSQPQVVIMTADGAGAYAVTNNDVLVNDFYPADWSADDKTLLVMSQMPGTTPSKVQTIDVASKTMTYIRDGFVPKRAWFKPAP